MAGWGHRSSLTDDPPEESATSTWPAGTSAGPSLSIQISAENSSPAVHWNFAMRALARTGRHAACTARYAGLGRAGQLMIEFPAAVGHGSLKHQLRAIEHRGFWRRASSKIDW
jgi:hypothetical protein